MNVIIFGGTGYIGSNLTADLLAGGYEVYIITRNPGKNIGKFDKNAHLVGWDSISPLTADEIPDSIDAIVNLSGESIGDKRWVKSVKSKIISSRINTTKAIVTAINSGRIKPKLLLNASAVGYYGPRGDEEIVETDDAGNDFLANVCKEWEKEAYKVKGDSTRVVTIRTGLVLGKEGALKRMALPFKYYIGGPLGSGLQWFSWIHIQDLTAMLKYIIENPCLSGPVNAVSPKAVRMKDFYRILGKVMNRPSWLPIPAFVLKLALGQLSEMLLTGQRVLPDKIMKAGFKHRYPELEEALENVSN